MLAAGRDLTRALSANEIEASRENVCAAIAVIDQESSFVANPTVAGLDACRKMPCGLNSGSYLSSRRSAELSRYVPPTPEDSYLKRIRNARPNAYLDLAYRDFVGMQPPKIRALVRC